MIPRFLSASSFPLTAAAAAAISSLASKVRCSSEKREREKKKKKNLHNQQDRQTDLAPEALLRQSTTILLFFVCWRYFQRLFYHGAPSFFSFHFCSAAIQSITRSFPPQRSAYREHLYQEHALTDGQTTAAVGTGDERASCPYPPTLSSYSPSLRSPLSLNGIRSNRPLRYNLPLRSAMYCDDTNTHSLTHTLYIHTHK